MFSVGDLDDLVDQHHTVSDNSDNLVSNTSIQIHNINNNYYNVVDTSNFTKTEIMGSASELSCLHSSLFNLICVRCGTNMSCNTSLPFGYMSPGLRLSRVEANRFRHQETQNLLKKKKLILVLDLDNTLLNSSSFSELTPDERYLLDDGVQTNGLVQLRPLVHKFLEQVNTMFELYVYTLAYRTYANQMVKLLDPDDNYFDSRVIAREDSLDRKKKNLDLVLGQEKAIVILDDRKEVWPTNNANLIQVHPYNYFSSSQPSDSKSKSLAEMKCDENEYIMGSYLHLLKRTHKEFFDEDPKHEVKVRDRDVRDVMRKLQVEILRGCKILLRHFSPMTKKELAKMAEKMGAMRAGKLEASVTHVVAVGKKAGTEEVLWAKRENKYLVDQRWLRDCYELWRRIPEHSYIL